MSGHAAPLQHPHALRPAVPLSGHAVPHTGTRLHSAVALSIANDYERWKYLRRSLKWYNKYQQCMACYLYLVSSPSSGSLGLAAMPACKDAWCRCWLVPRHPIRRLR